MSTLQSRFGPVDYDESDLVTLEDGLVGFAKLTRFLVLEHKPGSPFRWLQSIDEPATAFLVADPFHYVADYAPTLTDTQVAVLGLTPETATLIFATASIPRGKPEELKLNLAGPIVINAETRRGRQVVLEDEAYTTQHRVFQTADQHDTSAAA